jgi:heme iron utilization protein
MSFTQAFGASSPGGADGASPMGAAKPHADLARRLMRACDRATLATARRGADDGDPSAGWPYPSLVLVAFDLDGSPLLLMSTLAEHTRNLAADPRVGLLFDGTVGLDQPLTGARLSVLGRVARTDEPRHRARFLRRHPDAALYADFADFALHRVAIDRAHLVAGFGRIHWLTADELGLPERSVALAAALAQAEAALLEQANAALTAGSEGAGGAWTVTGLDPDGCDLRRGGAVARIDFNQSVNDSESVRLALAGLPLWVRQGGPQSGSQPDGPGSQEPGRPGAAPSDATTV